MRTRFKKLNFDWNAEPNAPAPAVEVKGDAVVLTFVANSFLFPQYAEEQRLRLTFKGARRYRLGPTNDEGWFKGQCRFSGIAPAWGEFYEVSGDLMLEQCPRDWHPVGVIADPGRHFLFYLRDDTFECESDDWLFEEKP